MGFLKPCFIKKNTPELRKKLEELGYKMGPIYSPNEQNLYVGGGIYASANFIDNYYLDCVDNEELFLALAALRDDTNEKQWFIMDVGAYTNINAGDWFIATDMNGGKHIGAQIEPTYCHKATVEAIIKHFKDK